MLSFPVKVIFVIEITVVIDVTQVIKVLQFTLRSEVITVIDIGPRGPRC